VGLEASGEVVLVGPPDGPADLGYGLVGVQQQPAAVSTRRLARFAMGGIPVEDLNSRSR
jgi:hypothetical protein